MRLQGPWCPRCGSYLALVHRGRGKDVRVCVGCGFEEPVADHYPPPGGERMDTVASTSGTNLLRAVGVLLLVAIPAFLVSLPESPLSPTLPEAMAAFQRALMLTALVVFGYVAFVLLRDWHRAV